MRCRHVKTARTKLEISAAEAVIVAMERVPRHPHIAKNENRFSFIEATPVASLQPMNEKRLINKANGSIIVGYARAENGAGGRQHTGSWSTGRCRSGLPEGVCGKAAAPPRPGDGADTV